MAEFPPKFGVANNVPLKEFTTIGVGGPARYLARVEDSRLFVELYQFCRKNKIRFLPLGHGTNVFFADEGFNGLVAVVAFSGLEYDGASCITVEAGAALKTLNQACLAHSLTGCEFTSGIPGTVGGAIYGNAGAYGSAVADILTEAVIMEPDGTILHVDNDYFGFDYRYSRLKETGSVVLSATFRFSKGDPEKIKIRVDEILALRRSKLPSHTVPTAGSYFKNLVKPDGSREAAAIYLDRIGSKSISVGGAGVHEKHANIFYNKNRATAKDILKLEEILKDKVYREFGIRLEREVMYIE